MRLASTFSSDQRNHIIDDDEDENIHFVNHCFRSRRDLAQCTVPYYTFPRATGEYHPSGALPGMLAT